MTKESYDFVIVGAGAAGCVVASYLAEHTDASIALIEAGETDRDPFIHIPAGFANILIHDRHVWKYETVPQHGTVRAYRAGRVLGGGSSINAMCYVRGQERDYAAWQNAVGDTGRWSYADLLPVFMAQEDNDTFHDDYHGVNGGLSVQLPKGINKLNQYCLKAFQEYGLPYNPDYNGESQIGVSPVQSTVGNQRRCSAADAYLRPHLASGRVTLLTDKTVTRILIENKRAVGVELHGTTPELILGGRGDSIGWSDPKSEDPDAFRRRAGRAAATAWSSGHRRLSGSRRESPGSSDRPRARLCEGRSRLPDGGARPWKHEGRSALPRHQGRPGVGQWHRDGVLLESFRLHRRSPPSSAIMFRSSRQTA